jgi:hypothetical protein
VIPRRIAGATHRFGAPVDWDEAKHGKCAHLFARVSVDGQSQMVESAWEPTPAEMEALIRGGSLILCIVGAQLPVSLYVEAPPEELAPECSA